MWKKKLKQQNSITYEFTLTNTILQEKMVQKVFKFPWWYILSHFMDAVFFWISKFVLQSGETYLFK